MEKIMRGDVDAQLRTLTTHMRDVLVLVADGEHTHGRAIAQKLGVPYPQAYNTLNSLGARGFVVSTEMWGKYGVRKAYTLTVLGQLLLEKSRISGHLDPEAAPPRVDPERYVEQMRIGPVFRWLMRHKVVSSYAELIHIMGCTKCNRLIMQYGFTGDVRCAEAAQKVNDKEWT